MPNSLRVSGRSAREKTVDKSNESSKKKHDSGKEKIKGRISNKLKSWFKKSSKETKEAARLNKDHDKRLKRRSKYKLLTTGGELEFHGDRSCSAGYLSDNLIEQSNFDNIMNTVVDVSLRSSFDKSDHSRLRSRKSSMEQIITTKCSDPAVSLQNGNN